MESNISEEQQKLLQKILNLAIENSAVRKGLIEDPAATIDRFSRVLGFGSDKLTLESLDLLASLTAEELEVLTELARKARHYKTPNLLAQELISQSSPVLPLSKKLRMKLEFALPYYATANISFEEKSDFSNRFLSYLIELYGIVRESVPLMKAAESKCKEIMETSPRDTLSDLLSVFYRDHTIEEANHDLWLLQDLETLGVPMTQVLTKRSGEKVAELVGAQYYWIRNLHPSVLLGYIMILEGYPMSKEDIERLVEKSALPRAGFRTLEEHSSLDISHLKALDKILDDLPLTKQQEEWITLNSFFTLRKCAEILESI